MSGYNTAYSKVHAGSPFYRLGTEKSAGASAHLKKYIEMTSGQLYARNRLCSHLEGCPLIWVKRPNK